MIRTINAINLDLGMGASVTVKLYADVSFMQYDLQNGGLYVRGEYFYYEGDTGNEEDKKLYTVLERTYTEEQYDALYDLLTITSTSKSDQVKEEINEAMMHEIVATFPTLGLNTTDFEIV